MANNECAALEGASKVLEESKMISPAERLFYARCAFSKSRPAGQRVPEGKVKVQWAKPSCKVSPCLMEEGTASAAIKFQCDGKGSEDDSETPEEFTEEKEDSAMGAMKCKGGKESPKAPLKRDSINLLKFPRRVKLGFCKAPARKFDFEMVFEEVINLFPEYFPSLITRRDSSEDKSWNSTEDCNRRARLLKQTSIEKIDRELGDRETKLIADSWLQIYS